MKVRIISLTLLIFSLIAHTEITSTFYEGKIEVHGSNKKKDVDIYINSFEKDNLTYLYGLIIKEDSASIYKIEELSDGSLLWFNLHQGANNLLKINSEFPQLEGTFFVKNKKKILKIITSNNTTNREQFSILAEVSENKQWINFPTERKYFKFGDNLGGELKDNIFKGDIIFQDASYSGYFHFDQIYPFLSIVRVSQPARLSLEEWKLERKILGIAVLIYSNSCGVFSKESNQLIFVKLPEGEQLAFYKTALASDKASGSLRSTSRSSSSSSSRSRASEGH